ncbi:MAG: DMT family transporter [Chitinophagaceae bacterium]|jgi:drug/metabolite transporter (DMT)-like permease|nr:DMT family transporter [Sediminibacterium sp.]
MQQKWINWLVFALLSLVWGSSFVLIKEGLRSFSPYQVASLRMLFAGLVLVPFAIKALPQIPKEKMGLVLISGVAGNFIPAFLFCIAETQIDSSLAGILNSLTPLFTILVGISFFKVQTNITKIIGVIIGFIGLCFLFAAGKDMSMRNMSYAGLVLMATLFYGINVNMVGRYLQNIGALNIASVAFSFLVLPSAAILFFTGYFNNNFTNQTVIQSSLASAVLGIIGTSLASILFYYLIKKAGVIFGSLVTYGIPIVAVCWGMVYGEKITPMQYVWMGVILLGVFIANRPMVKRS